MNAHDMVGQATEEEAVALLEECFYSLTEELALKTLANVLTKNQIEDLAEYYRMYKG